MNETEEFINNVLTEPEDYKYVHKLGQINRLQAEGMRQKKALVENNEARIQKRKEASEKGKAKVERVKQLKLALDKEEIAKLRGQNLNFKPKLQACSSSKSSGFHIQIEGRPEKGSNYSSCR